MKRKDRYSAIEWKNVLLIWLSALPFLSFAQSGMVKEHLSLESDILGREVHYSIYLPPNYEQSERYYPTVYLLHGYTDNESGWIQYGEVNRLADEAIRTGQIPPMVIIMPDAGVTWYINDHQGEEKYEDFFIQEFIPAMERTYRIRAEKRHRGVAGLSMGGYGSLIYAIKHPDLFSGASALSAAIYTDEEYAEMSQSRWNSRYGILYGEGLKGRKRVTQHLRANNVYDIIRSMEKSELDRLPDLYLDCGDDDYWSAANARFHILLQEKDVDHEYRVREGGHNWTYWRTGLVNALSFLGDNFRLR